jgi:ABC-type nitrate/sulfonate/bicarbonate transport system substrate-binding protein
MCLMRSMISVRITSVCVMLLAGCGGGGSGADGSQNNLPVAGSTASVPLRIVATPNPNVFPLLLAMARQPTLGVALVPIADGAQIDSTFAAGGGDALLSMTYTAAKKVTSGKVPGLQLVRVNLWRGFSALTPKDMAVTNFAQLVGKGVLVSGPTSGGKGGGPDLIFQAALKRSGFSLSDFKVCYLPVMEAAPMMAEQKKMNSNPACDSSFDMPPTAISLVEPAATGMVMQTLMPTSAAATVLSSSVDYQSLFSGFTAWPAAQLPHGGLTVLKTVLDDVGRKAQTAQVLAAYDAAVAEIATADTLSKRMEIAQIVSTGITKFYGSMGLTLPAPVIAAALSSQDLVMRGDLGVDAVQADLQRFLNEVVGVTVPVTFYRSGV